MVNVLGFMGWRRPSRPTIRFAVLTRLVRAIRGRAIIADAMKTRRPEKRRPE